MNSQTTGLPVKDWLRPDEAATYLRVSIQTIYRWHNNGDLEGGKTKTGLLRFKRDIIINFIKETSIE